MFVMTLLVSALVYLFKVSFSNTIQVIHFKHVHCQKVILNSFLQLCLFWIIDSGTGDLIVLRTALAVIAVD